MKLFSGFANWRSGALNALSRFPWNILCGATGAVSLIAANHWSSNESIVGQSIRLAMTTAVGMPLFFSLRMIREAMERRRHWPIEIVGLLLLVGWFLAAQPARPFDAPGIIWIRWLLLLAALHFFSAVSANLSRPESLGFWQFNRRLFLRFCLATPYTGVLTAGLELALLSADKLFQIKIGRMYGDLFFLMIGFFHPAFFLAGVPRDFQALDADSEYPRGLKAFTQFALAPLVAVYTAILYAYAIKIIVARSWPHGWVALPVLLLSGIGILAFLLLYPLRTRPEEKWAVWFTRNFPRALAPLSVLLLLSVHVRVREYGVTEERYLGIVAALWILAWSLVFLFSKSYGIRWIPSSLAAICLLAAFGPWSAGNTSKRSQLRRVIQILQEHGLWKDNHAQPATGTVELSKKEGTSLETTLRYLVGTHGGNVIRSVFEQALPNRDWQKMSSWPIGSDVVSALKISVRGGLDTSATVNRKRETFLDVQGYRRIWHAYVYSGRDSDWVPSRCEDLAIGIDHGVLKLAIGNDRDKKDVPMESVFNHLDSIREGQLPDEHLRVDFQQGGRTFRISVESLSFDRAPEGVRLSACDLHILEK